MSLERGVDELLKRGVEDWIDAVEVAYLSKLVLGASDEAEIQAKALDLVRTVLERGLMTIGDVNESGFQAWLQTPDVAVERVKQHWRNLGRSPLLGELFWLSNTPRGDLRGNALLDDRAPG